MDAAVNPEVWHEFAVMVGGAFAALAGLLVVAMSISIEEILAHPSLARRAGASLVTTISPLLAAIFILVPEQSSTTLGWELVGLGILLAIALPIMNRPAPRTEGQTPLEWVTSIGIPMFVLIAAVLLAGVGVLRGSGGLYWLVPAVIAALLGGVMQAWILLVEIRR